MYEAEINNSFSSVAIPSHIKSSFKEYRHRVALRSILPWSEHCVECVWPTCYSTCSLYSPREDKRCRLFVKGMVRVDNPGGLNDYLIEIIFKRWGKLWCPGSVHMFHFTVARRFELVNHLIGMIVTSKVFPKCVRAFAAKYIYSFKKKFSRQFQKSSINPDCYLMECYNPYEEEVGITLTIRSDEKNSIDIFQKKINLIHGFNRVETSMSEICKSVDMSKPFSIDITHDQKKNELMLYFGFIDFVKYSHTHSINNHKIKCVVWDLDNTLWKGILTEDGPEKIEIETNIKEIITELDNRGILQSISSKNNYNETIDFLKRHKIDEYFLYPQISWEPKSESIKRLAKNLNIGIDTILFIDDQAFEREEVLKNCEGVSVFDPINLDKLLSLPECNVPKTAESVKRRLLYKQDVLRLQAMEQFDGKYFEFLRSCDITLKIGPLLPDNIERVYELAQRTNQMNFSGNRYSKPELEVLVNSNLTDTFVLECSDKFGDYGIIGFAAVEKEKNILIDLMFSCRVQSKRVEHAFLSYLLTKYIPQSINGFWIKYHKTDKNAKSATVFNDFSFTKISDIDDNVLLNFPKTKIIPQDNIIKILPL